MSEVKATLPTRCGFVSLLGAPNSGKSTLVNALVGTKVSIVSHKVQTTRVPVRGIVLHERSQIVLNDTPGIFEPKRRLDRAMVDAAWSRAADADIVLVIVDAVKGIDDDVARVLERIKGGRLKRVLVLNKIDRIQEKGRLLALTEDITKRVPFDRVFMISALEGKGVSDLKDHLAQAVPEGPWHYPEDEVTDLPIRMLAAEITRERIYHWLHDELPYATTVETTSWQKHKNKAIRIEQTIFVERESQRAIVLGQGGAMIKKISMEARKEIGEIAEAEVHLFLFVKVRENWLNDPERYSEMGLDFPKT